MTKPKPEKCHPDDRRLPAILSLIQSTFAYMDGRIDPPSSMNKLTLNAIAKQCETGEVWVYGDPPMACIFLKPNDGRLYLGKLAVSPELRSKGIARKMIELAEKRAIALGFDELELEVRIELSENHRLFEKLGFLKTGEGAHDGFDRPTFITMRKPARK